MSFRHFAVLHTCRSTDRALQHLQHGHVAGSGQGGPPARLLPQPYGCKRSNCCCQIMSIDILLTSHVLLDCCRTRSMPSWQQDWGPWDRLTSWPGPTPTLDSGPCPAQCQPVQLQPAWQRARPRQCLRLQRLPAPPLPLPPACLRTDTPQTRSCHRGTRSVPRPARPAANTASMPSLPVSLLSRTLTEALSGPF